MNATGSKDQQNAFYELVADTVAGVMEKPSMMP